MCARWICAGFCDFDRRKSSVRWCFDFVAFMLLHGFCVCCLLLDF